jgi:hypothetical protein
MFRSYDHHQAEKYITTLGLLNWQRIRNRMQTPRIKFDILDISYYLKNV